MAGHSWFGRFDGFRWFDKINNCQINSSPAQ